MLLVGPHDNKDPILNVYSELYRLIGVDPPDSAWDKAGNWEGLCREMIPVADERFTQHLAELESGEAGER